MPQKGRASGALYYVFFVVLVLTLKSVPLNDTYDPEKRDYQLTLPPPTLVDEVSGILTWGDIMEGGPPPEGEPNRGDRLQGRRRNSLRTW